MPLVQVTMLQGRTADQKRKIAQRMTDAMVEEAGARREAVVVTFLEVSKESYASGGVLMADKGQSEGQQTVKKVRPAPHPRSFSVKSSQRLEQMSFDPVAEFRQVLLCHLQEVRGRAMRFEGGVVLVLLIDKEPAWIGLVLMHLIHEAARFLARFG